MIHRVIYPMISSKTHRTPRAVSGEDSSSSGFQVYSPAQVDGIWGIWGCYYNIPKAIFYLLKGDYRVSGDSGCGCCSCCSSSLSFC